MVTATRQARHNSKSLQQEQQHRRNNVTSPHRTVERPVIEFTNYWNRPHRQLMSLLQLFHHRLHPHHRTQVGMHSITRPVHSMSSAVAWALAYARLLVPATTNCIRHQCALHDDDAIEHISRDTEQQRFQQPPY